MSQQPQKQTVIWGLFGTGLAALAIGTYGQSTQSKDIQAIAGAVWMGFFTLVVIAIIGHRATCPQCHWWWAKTTGEKKLVREEFVNKVVQRKETMSGGGLLLGSSGLNVAGGGGTKFRDEAAKVLRRHYDQHFRCKFCGHQWITQSHEDTEEYVLPT